MTTPIDVSEEEGVRYLHFGSRWIQGAMRLARPNALELDYTRDMMMPLLLRGGAGWPRSVLLIGLGAASLTRFLHKHRPRAAQTIVEIEPAVIAAARQFFKLPPESARMRIEIADGADFVAYSDREFDLILVDGYDAKARTGMLDTLPFYCNCQARLSERGVLAANLLTRNHGIRGSLDRVQRRVRGTRARAAQVRERQRRHRGRRRRADRDRRRRAAAARAPAAPRDGAEPRADGHAPAGDAGGGWRAAAVSATEGARLAAVRRAA